MNLIKENINDTFLKGYYIDESICDDLIAYWKESKDKQPGIVMIDGYRQIDPDKKVSTDVTIPPHSQDVPYRNYIEELKKAAACYMQDLPWCNEYSPWDVIEQLVVQYYPPGGGFKSWHTERPSPQFPIATRHLVFMTYLNDVDDEGGTEFVHQKLKLKARKGLTVIWPADWTYTHRGVPSPTQEKWIITGWFNYI